MTASGPFRSSVRVITEPTDTAADGSPVKKPETPLVIDWSPSTVWWWEIRAMIRHLFHRHTFVDNEVWTYWESEGVKLGDVAIEGQVCWLCPARR